jgi:hypothetical protein
LGYSDLIFFSVFARGFFFHFCHADKSLNAFADFHLTHFPFFIEEKAAKRFENSKTWSSNVNLIEYENILEYMNKK